MVVRIFCRAIVHVLRRIAIGIYEAEVEFLLCMVGKRRHGFLQSPQFDEDGSGNGRIFAVFLSGQIGELWMISTLEALV